MSIPHPIARCLSAVAAASSLLFLALPSQAAVIASFDPAFDITGTNNPNLGFRGFVTLDVSQGCYDDAAASSSNYAFTGSTCTITPIATSQINFYNSTTDPTGTTPLAGSPFDLLPYLQASYVTGIYIVGGVALGIDSVDSLVFPVSAHDGTVGDPTAVNYDGEMLLYFVSGFEPTLVGRGFLSAAAVNAPNAPGAHLVDCTRFIGEGESSCNRFDYLSSDPARVTITAVPEPGVLSLSLLGLAALVGARRRKAIPR